MTGNQLHEICKVLGEATTHAEISHMLATLNLVYPLTDETRWARIYNAIVKNQDKIQPKTALIQIIEWIMSPSLYVDKQDDFIKTVDNLNKRLSFIGLKLLPTGKVINSDHIATTLEEANQTVSQLKSDLHKFKIHPQILAFCRPEIVSQNLFHLIFEASKCLLDNLRSISGLQYDGNTLVNRCFDGKNPLVVMNKLSTENERSEHKGLQSLLNAIVYLYRNPKAHYPKYFSDDTYQSTLAALILISQARYALERCFRNICR